MPTEYAFAPMDRRSRRYSSLILAVRMTVRVWSKNRRPLKKWGIFKSSVWHAELNNRDKRAVKSP